jgi:DNA-directed RNA polymerase subunit RPC12/RpoP
VADKRRLKSKYDDNPEAAREKAREAYYQNHAAKKKIARESVKRARFSNPERIKSYKLKSTYGIGLEEVTTLLESQEYKCVICQRKLSIKVKSKDLRAYVDHDHKTGVVRGVLCVHCNSLIGYSRENKTVLLAAIDYLKKFGK